MTIRSKLLPALAVAVLLSACERVKDTMPITETRIISAHAQAPLLTEPQAQHPFLWTTPVGWTEGTPSQMRIIDLKFGAQQEGECYVTALQGAGGGVAANINRWRGQFGQAALSETEVEKLPKKPFLGSAAHFVTIEGEFTGMGTTPQKNYKMLGVIQEAPGLMLFVKMVGPKALVDEHSAAFDTFLSSLRFRPRDAAAAPNP